MVLWDKCIHNFRIWVLDFSLLDQQLSAGWTVEGDKPKTIEISHSSFYPNLTWRSLHGKPMHHNFVDRTHPSRHAFLWHARLAYDVAMGRGRVPKDVPDLDAIQLVEVTPSAHDKVNRAIWLPL